MRKTGGDTGIEQLAELIAAEGVLQNLDVYECENGEGKKKTTHAVVAGGRRWRALQLLIRQKRIKPDFAVPCLIVSYERAVQISLAENSGREPMHPADEFDAFRQLIDAGQSSRRCRSALWRHAARRAAAAQARERLLQRSSTSIAKARSRSNI